MQPRTFQDLVRPELEQQPNPRPEPGDRLAGVLAPVLIEENDAVVFTERPGTLSRHPGQVAFPGGLLHEGESPSDAALRETEEEIGLPRSQVELLGALPPVHTVVSGILVVPFVGAVRGRPVFRPNAEEIADVFEVPVARLLGAEREEEWERAGRRFRSYVYDVDGHRIWGATAHMVHLLLEIVRGKT